MAALRTIQLWCKQRNRGGSLLFLRTHQSRDWLRVEPGVVQLKGWLNGDGFIFANSGNVADLTSSFQIGGTNYASRQVLDLVQPARVMWDYGDRIF